MAVLNIYNYNVEYKCDPNAIGYAEVNIDFQKCHDYIMSKFPQLDTLLEIVNYQFPKTIQEFSEFALKIIDLAQGLYFGYHWYKDFEIQELVDRYPIMTTYFEELLQGQHFGVLKDQYGRYELPHSIHYAKDEDFKRDLDLKNNAICSCFVERVACELESRIDIIEMFKQGMIE